MGASELSGICQKLLDAEIRNGLLQGRDYIISLQVNAYVDLLISNREFDHCHNESLCFIPTSCQSPSLQ